MDASMTFSRTEKGREELLGSQHTLKQRQRQVLFLINDAISVAAIREKLPACQELEGILELLWQESQRQVPCPQLIPPADSPR